jgi:hypothetical protein
MTEKEYRVKLQGASEWESSISEFSCRKAAIVFIKQTDGLSNEDSVVVLERNDGATEEVVFKVSKLLGKESENKVHLVAVELDEPKANDETAKASAAKTDKAELRKHSSYKDLRCWITLLAIVAYCIAAMTIVLGLVTSIAVESLVAILLCLLYGALAVVGIYVAHALLHAFVDIADVQLGGSGRSSRKS